MRLPGIPPTVQPGGVVMDEGWRWFATLMALPIAAFVLAMLGFLWEWMKETKENEEESAKQKEN